MAWLCIDPSGAPLSLPFAALFAQGVSDRSIARLPNNIKVGALVSITAQGSDKVVAVGYLNQSKADLAKHLDKAVITVSSPIFSLTAPSLRLTTPSIFLSYMPAVITSG